VSGRLPLPKIWGSDPAAPPGGCIRAAAQGERAARQRSGSVAPGICTCVGYGCRVGSVAGDGRRIRSDLGDGWLDSVENRSVGEQPVKVRGQVRMAGSHKSSGPRGRVRWDRTRPRWPVIILRSPKGWTGPAEVDGVKVTRNWRSHQVPLSGVREKSRAPASAGKLAAVHHPEELFDERGLPRLAGGLHPHQATRHVRHLGGVCHGQRLPDGEAQQVARGSSASVRGTTRTA
jgi:hypothetical protein